MATSLGQRGWGGRGGLNGHTDTPLYLQEMEKGLWAFPLPFAFAGAVSVIVSTLGVLAGCVSGPLVPMSSKHRQEAADKIHGYASCVVGPVIPMRSANDVSDASSLSTSPSVELGNEPVNDDGEETAEDQGKDGESTSELAVVVHERSLWRSLSEQWMPQAAAEAGGDPQPAAEHDGDPQLGEAKQALEAGTYGGARGAPLQPRPTARHRRDGDNDLPPLHSYPPHSPHRADNSV